MSNDEFAMVAGFDALTYIRYMGLCLRLSIFIAIFSIGIALTVNQTSNALASSDTVHTNFDETTLGNVADKNRRHWAHVIVIVIVALGTMWVRVLASSTVFTRNGSSFQMCWHHVGTSLARAEHDCIYS
jgi:type IV secretory pathway VirB2 component (pilin)